MRNYNKYAVIIVTFLVTLIVFSSCKDFLNPEQEINITEDKLYSDWYEYRSVEMGMYGIQSKLVEQIVLLGELRADLVQITENADADMVEIYNFNISKDNKYASPTTFFELISASNNFIRILQEKQPQVLDPKVRFQISINFMAKLCACVPGLILMLFVYMGKFLLYMNR